MPYVIVKNAMFTCVINALISIQNYLKIIIIMIQEKKKRTYLLVFAKENGHSIELKFFCKSHNQLCCVGCISKIKGNGYGQHTDCEVCFIDEITAEKKNNLKDNLKFLENISFSFEKTMKELKEILEKINENKENLKIEISKTFTKLRNSLNER